MERKILIAISIACIFLVVLIAYALTWSGGEPPHPWSEVVRLTESEDVATSPSLIEYGNAMYLFYADRGIAQPVRLAFMRGGFYEWSDPVYLTNETYLPTDIHAVVFENEIYIFWEDSRSPLPIIYAVHGDGKKWSDPVKIDEGRYPSPLAVGERLYVAYSGTNGRGLKIAVLDGDGWKLHTLSETGRSPRLVVVGNSAYVVWSDGGVIKASRLASSVALTEIVDIAEVGTDIIRLPVCPAENGFYVAWSQFVAEGNYEVYVNFVSTSTGTPAPAPAERVSHADGLSTDPSVAWRDGILYVAWADKRTGTYQVMLRIKKGGAWGDELTVSGGDVECTSPHIFNFSSAPYLIWERHEKPFNLWGTELKKE